MDKLIQEAAKKYASVFSSTHRDRSIAGFEAGATFFRDEVMRGEVEKLLEWIKSEGWFPNGNGSWARWAAPLADIEIATSAQLYDKYFEQLKQQQDEQAGKGN